MEGIRFETIVPEQIEEVSFSEISDTSSPIRMGLKITNNTSVSQRFCSDSTLIPTLVGADGFVTGCKLGGGGLGWVGIRESDFHLVSSGESVTFFVSVHIERERDGLFNLIVDGTARGYWSLPDLKLGIYQIRLTYNSSIDSFGTPLSEDFWRGMVNTPFVEFCLFRA
ncbi:MAG: hypothetical protein WA896_00880 [Spirulinaceae cyanobacterium]